QPLDRTYPSPATGFATMRFAFSHCLVSLLAVAAICHTAMGMQKQQQSNKSESKRKQPARLAVSHTPGSGYDHQNSQALDMGKYLNQQYGPNSRLFKDLDKAYFKKG
ncbi:hypothetical protein H4R34_005460, partial [Dimargaris verticillata]